VDAFLPPFAPRQVLDPAAPLSIGAMVGPEAFMEVRYLDHQKQSQALELIPELSREFRDAFGRDSGGLLRGYRATDADTLVVAMGSVNGTIQETVDQLRAEGMKIGSVSLCSYRPFPAEALRRALGCASEIVVVEKCVAVGMGGILSMEIRNALSGLPLTVSTVVAGLGGRAITQKALRAVFQRAQLGQLQPLTFLGLNENVVSRELERQRDRRHSGPPAENILRDLRSPVCP
jgi:pyruvate ferredoxin oxidoreductase alpha subunit